MAYRLRDRNRQIPNGYKYLQPETAWQPRRFDSFERIVNALISHRKSNPHLLAQKKWATDHDTVANEVDAFNALVCARHGWTEYLAQAEEFAPSPKPMALLQQERSEIAAVAAKAIKIWSGIKTLDSWIDSGTAPVASDLAERRAAVCAACPRNGQGDFSSWFTRPAAEAIKRQLERMAGMKLKTSLDDKLNVCEVCLCPLKLKVHTPMSFIAAHLPPAVSAELRAVPNCWIPQELGK